MSKELREVREYEEFHGKRIPDEERPAFHLTP